MKYNSKQEVFDAVVKHAEQMNKPSVSNTGNCLYRSEDGGKCLVGALIEDEDYNRDMDDNDGDFSSTSVCDLAEYGLIPEYLIDYVDLLIDCQKAHDREAHQPVNFWKEYMIEKLKDIAHEHKLQYNGVL